MPIQEKYEYVILVSASFKGFLASAWAIVSSGDGQINFIISGLL